MLAIQVLVFLWPSISSDNPIWRISFLSALFLRVRDSFSVAFLLFDSCECVRKRVSHFVCGLHIRSSSNRIHTELYAFFGSSTKCTSSWKTPQIRVKMSTPFSNQTCRHSAVFLIRGWSFLVLPSFFISLLCPSLCAYTVWCMSADLIYCWMLLLRKHIHKILCTEWGKL